eukprot:scaffold56409_cov66-Phaeocystis_antarctica.AAC.6
MAVSTCKPWTRGCTTTATLVLLLLQPHVFADGLEGCMYIWHDGRSTTTAQLRPLRAPRRAARSNGVASSPMRPHGSAASVGGSNANHRSRSAQPTPRSLAAPPPAGPKRRALTSRAL